MSSQRPFERHEGLNGNIWKVMYALMTSVFACALLAYQNLPESMSAWPIYGCFILMIIGQGIAGVIEQFQCKDAVMEVKKLLKLRDHTTGANQDSSPRGNQETDTS